MVFTISPLAPVSQPQSQSYNDDNNNIPPPLPSIDSDGDIDMGLSDGRPSKRPKLGNAAIVTPGETVTEDPQWMRCNPNSNSNSKPLSSTVQQLRLFILKTFHTPSVD